MAAVPLANHALLASSHKRPGFISPLLRPHTRSVTRKASSVAAAATEPLDDSKKRSSAPLRWQEPLRNRDQLTWISDFRVFRRMLRPAEPQFCPCPLGVADKSLAVREYLRSYSTASLDALGMFQRPRHPVKPFGWHLPDWMFRIAKEAKYNDHRVVNALRHDARDCEFQRLAQPGSSSRLYQILYCTMFVSELMTTMIGDIPRAEETRVYPPGLAWVPESDCDEDEDDDENDDSKKTKAHTKRAHPWCHFDELKQASVRTIRIMSQIILDERYAYSLCAVYTMAAACTITQIKVLFEWVARQRRENDWLATYDTLRRWKRGCGPRPPNHVTDTPQLWSKYYEWDMRHALGVFESVALKLHGSEWMNVLRANVCLEDLHNAERWILMLFDNDVVLDVCDPVMSHLCHNLRCTTRIDGCFEPTCIQCDTQHRVYEECIKLFASLDPAQFRVHESFITGAEHSKLGTNVVASMLPSCQVVAHELGKVVCHFMDPQSNPGSSHMYSDKVQDIWLHAIYFAVTPTIELAERFVALKERDRSAKLNTNMPS